MTSRTTAILAVLLSTLALPVAAAEKPKTPAPSTLPGKVANVDVTVTNLDVVVTDSKGNRVTGLKKEDFEVIEDNLTQNITNFYAVEQGRLAMIGEEVIPPPNPAAPAPEPSDAPPLPNPKIRIIIFIDNLHLQPFNRNRVLRNVEDYVRTSVKGDVEAMIVSWNRTLKIRKKFTNDGRDLADVLKQIEEESAFGTNQASERRDLIRQIDDSKSADQSVSYVRTWVQSLVNDMEFTFDAMKTTLNQLSGVEGRKILIHVSDGLPQSPGAEMWQYVQDKFRTSSIATLQNFEFDKTTRYAGLIQQANAAGVTIYTIDATGLSVDESVTAENRTNAERLNGFVERQNLQSMLQLMSEETGGRAILNKNDVTVSLKEIEKDYSSYYSLGYRSVRSGLDRPHKVEVKVKRKGLEARARRSYLEKSPETRITEAVNSALYFSRDENPLAAALEVGQPAPADRQNYIVPVRVRVPYSRITLFPEGPKVRGRVILYFVVLDSEGKKSDLATQDAVIEMDAKRAESVAKQDFIYDAKLLMIPGGQKLSVGVRDEYSNTVSYLQKAVFVSVLPQEIRDKK